jgi:hypothetical protein
VTPLASLVFAHGLAFSSMVPASHALPVLPAWLRLAAVGPAFAAFPPPPDHFAQKLECAAPEVGALDKPFPLRCAAAPGSGAVTVVLYFRQGGAQEFTPAPTLRTDRGWFVSWLCAHDLVPGPLQYYFEARDAAGRVVAESGNEDSPSVLMVQGESAPWAAGIGGAGAALPRTRSTIGDDNDPLAAVRHAQAADQAAAVRAQRRGAGPYVGASVGVGHGYFPERALDFHKELATPANFGSAGLPLWLPEVGWQFDNAMAASIQLRWQNLGTEGTGDPLAGSPAKRSYAVLVRGAYQFGEGLWQPFLAANLGVGDGFRLVVPARPNDDPALLRDDTVRAGPFVAGPSAGTLYHLNPHVAFAGELRLLAGMPDFALAGELSLGMQVAF